MSTHESAVAVPVMMPYQRSSALICGSSPFAVAVPAVPPYLCDQRNLRTHAFAVVVRAVLPYLWLSVSISGSLPFVFSRSSSTAASACIRVDPRFLVVRRCRGCCRSSRQGPPNPARHFSAGYPSRAYASVPEGRLSRRPKAANHVTRLLARCVPFVPYRPLLSAVVR